jgi:hypothetical protein
VRGVNLRILGQCKKFLVKAAVEQRSQFMRGVSSREIRPAHITDKKRVSREHRFSPLGLLYVSQNNTDALDCVTRSLEEIEAAVPELNKISIPHRQVHERCAGTFPDVDVGAGAFGKFPMPGNEVCVQMRLDDMLDPDPLACRRLDVDLDVTLGIDDSGRSSGRDEVGRVGEAAEVETLDLNGFHAFS